MEQLTIKPRWWSEQQEEIQIVGRKLPLGIKASVVHRGILYKGELYPVEVVKHEN